MPAVMVWGCSSWAGKSLLVTALCRWYARQGLSVAPFKGQNMANNARVVVGGEIGTAQYMQSLAARVTPDVRMNPVLLKPEGETRSQVVRLGHVDHELSRRPWRDRSEALWPDVRDALHDLLAAHDLVVMEGAGSPAEINLQDRDIVNLRPAREADAAALLVADIDRGGAFASLFGTWSLMPDDDRERLRGFVLNRFRGDASLLAPGPADLEAMTGVPTIGVVPMLDHALPDEDGADVHQSAPADAPTVAVVRYPTASNLDEFALLEQVAHVRWARSPAAVRDADVVVLPGSKHVAHDLRWLHDAGVGAAVTEAARAGRRVLGICGGLQMLGERLDDPHGVDGDGVGLGLLPLTTTFAPDKQVVHTATAFADTLDEPWRVLAGRAIDGYEIRMGRTTLTGRVAEVLPDGRGWAHGSVLGVYVHGLLEDPGLLAAIVGRAPERPLEHTFDLLADAVDGHLDTALLRSLAG